MPLLLPTAAAAAALLRSSTSAAAAAAPPPAAAAAVAAAALARAVARRPALAPPPPPPQPPAHGAAPFSSSSSSAAAASSSSSDNNVDGRIGADADEVAELIEANIVRPSRTRRADAPPPGAPRLLTTRREALGLYREVLRYSKLFVWRDEHGRPWRDVLRASARAEFEAARREPDPELIGRMIVTGRDAVRRAVEGLMARRERIIAEEAADPRVPPMRQQ